MKFHTSVSSGYQDGLKLRGMGYLELMQSMGFVEALYFALAGRKPNKAQTKIFNIMLTASLEHGIVTPINFVPRVVASTGSEVTHALASGVLAIGPQHGGAIDGAAEMFYRYVHEGQTSISGLVSEMRKQRRRVPGFGHPFYEDQDPKAEYLLKVAKDEGCSGDYVAVAREFEKALEDELGKKKVLNIDGAIAAVMLEIGLPKNAGNGLFALASMGGMLAHVLEEIEQNEGTRVLADHEVNYE